MKTVFGVGMKVYDQMFFPDKEGKVEEIYISEGQEYPIVLFEGKKERVCYNFEGCLSDCITKTLSTKPYKVEFQGFEQKAPIPTFEHALDWVISTIKDNYFIELDKQLKALNKLIILRDYYNEGWQPDWKSDNKKYIIECYEVELRVIGIFGTGAILHFRKLNIAERFLEEQKELLEIAKPLL